MLLRFIAVVLFFNVSTAWGQEQSSVPLSTFPPITNSEPLTSGWLSPTEALNSLKLPSGFSASLFAAEPDVQNPIAISIDPQGRVWIAENYTYAERTARFDLNFNDRVVVLEDTNNDGVADKRTVFTDSVKMLSGIVTGQGGVWLMCPPQLLFIPDANGDLVPDGPPEVRLDGFHVARENYHNFANGLSWGPDGWLVGRCGASCPGELGLPGCIDDDRIPIRGGMWRFHPQRGIVEALTHGTTNPWGHDWNEVGDLFFINTVNGHLWHAIPGAHFTRPHTIDANPHTYELIDTHADHWHFDTGQSWTQSRNGAANDYGGGHAHVGMMIYHGEAWPKEFRGNLMTINMHGRRVNREHLEIDGSGYTGRHAPDFLLSDDTWFRGMDIVNSPDGNALLIDWSDTGECHDHTGVHRTSGRIYKIQHATAQTVPPPLRDENPAELATLLTHGSEWIARRAREELRAKFLFGYDCSEASIQLWQGLAQSNPPLVRLRSLWGLKQVDAVEQSSLLSLLNDPDTNLRRWVIRLLMEQYPIDNSDGTRPRSVDVLSMSFLPKLISLAKTEKEPRVRLELASCLQRLSHPDRVDLARALCSHPEDEHDHNLPLMVWYGITPLGEDYIAELISLLPECQWPTIQRLISRRVADQVDSKSNVLNDLVAVTQKLTTQQQNAVLQGISEAMAGRRHVPMPTEWQSFRDNLANQGKRETEDILQQLDVLFGDGRAINELVALAADNKQPLDLRMSALQSLVSARADGLERLCRKLLGQRYLNIVAAEGLALASTPAIGEEIIKHFRSFAPLDRPRVISLLTTRVPWALSLLNAVARGDIDRDEISPYQARQIANLGDEDLTRILVEQWGQVRETPTERTNLIKQLKLYLSDENLSRANKSEGRLLFQKNCAGCHSLFGSGGKLGPDLTGAQRSNMDYLLENIIDPSAVVTNEFRATIVVLKDGRVLTGLATAKTDSLITLATQNETYRVPMNEIEETKKSTASTMPDGLLSSLSREQILNLIGYLQSKEQISFIESTPND